MGLLHQQRRPSLGLLHQRRQPGRATLSNLASQAWGQIIGYGYDNADLLTSATDFNGNTITVGNTADGLRATAALASTGDTITTSYDNADGVSSVALANASATLQSLSYSDAPARTILSECDSTTSCSQPSASYTYDAKGRVTSMTPGRRAGAELRL